MSELFEEYEQMFGEPFPRYSALGMEDEAIRDAIEDCLVTGKPFNPDVPEGALI